MTETADEKRALVGEFGKQPPVQGSPEDAGWQPWESRATSKIMTACSRFIGRHGAYLQRRSLWAACCHAFSVGYRRGFDHAKRGGTL
jgi:hypothetical protein